jgi:tetratricopeptide (TPR) repeat protein
MKFTNKFVVLLAVGFVLLSGCSSLLPSDEVEQKVVQINTESLTPIQIEVNKLLTQPNLYKTQISGHKTNAQVLSQFKKALQLKQQGKFTEAKQSLMTLSEQYPNLSGIWLQLALIAKELEKDDIDKTHKSMTKYLNNAISVNPLNYLAHNELALVLRQQGQFKQALSHYELALKSWPAFAEGYLNRGILYDLYMGKKSMALADYELYQVLSNDDSRQLKGWIIDLQRQIKSAEKSTQAGAM